MSFHRLTVSVPRQALPSLSSSLSALTSLGGFTLLPPETSGDSSSVGFASSAQSLVLKFVPSDEFGASGPVRIERGGFMDEGLREVLSVAPKGAEESRLKVRLMTHARGQGAYSLRQSCIFKVVYERFL